MTSPTVTTAAAPPSRPATGGATPDTASAAAAGPSAPILQPPADYGDPAAEVAAVREAVGLADLPGAGVIRVTGKDRIGFLHGLLSSAVDRLPAGRSHRAFLLDPKGHAVAMVHVLHRAEEVLLLTESGQAGRLAADLERYHIMEKVAIRDESATVRVIGVDGPAAGDLLNDALGLDAVGVEPDVHFGFRFTPAGGGPCDIVALPGSWSGTAGFRLMVPVAAAEAVTAALAARGTDHGLRRVGHTAQEQLRIAAGRPSHPAEINESVLGPELALPDAFAMGKCYPGQEVVARIESRGHVNRRLSRLRIAGPVPPPAGSEVRWGEGAAGKKVATLTSVAPLPDPDGVMALGFVRREAYAPGTAVRVVTPDGVRDAVVL